MEVSAGSHRWGQQYKDISSLIKQKENRGKNGRRSSVCGLWGGCWLSGEMGQVWKGEVVGVGQRTQTTAASTPLGGDLT